MSTNLYRVWIAAMAVIGWLVAVYAINTLWDFWWGVLASFPVSVTVLTALELVWVMRDNRGT